MKCAKEFQMIAPDVEYLGHNIYSIKNEKVKELLEKYIAEKTIIIPGVKFSKIIEQYSEYTRGEVTIQGEDYFAACQESTGKYIVQVPYDFVLPSEEQEDE